MTQGTRRIAALGMLVASCAAILATTPGEPTASAAVEGEVAVAPDSPSEVVVRFVVSSDGAEEIDRGSILFSSDFFTESFATPIDLRVTAVADGVDADPDSDWQRSFVLPMRACRDGCDVEVRALMTWTGPPGDGMRARWNAGLSVVYENSVPPGEPVTATIVDGQSPPLGRNTWLAVGAFLALVAGAVCVAIGSRLSRIRIGLAALAVLPPAWLLVQFAVVDLGKLLRYFDWATVLVVLTAVLLAVALVVGVVRTARGDPIALPAAGWAYLVIVGYLLWLRVDDFGTYRPHELVVLTASLAIPGMAAVTAMPPERPIASASRRFGTSFVMAALIAEFAVTVGVAVGILAAFVLSIATRGGRVDVGPVLLAGLPLLVAVGFVRGFRRWPSGDRRFLGAASTATFLVLLLLMFFTFSGQGGFFIIRLEAAAVVVICFVVNLAGLIGLEIFPPPARSDPPDHEGHDERGQREQVAGVADEADVDRGWDRA